MIKRYGLSKKFKNMVFGDDNDEVFLGYSMGQVQSYSDQTAAMIDSEIQQIIDDCYEETKRILNEKRSVVEALAKRLMEKNTVDAEEFERIFTTDGACVYDANLNVSDNTPVIGGDDNVALGGNLV